MDDEFSDRFFLGHPGIEVAKLNFHIVAEQQRRMESLSHHESDTKFVWLYIAAVEMSERVTLFRSCAVHRTSWMPVMSVSIIPRTSISWTVPLSQLNHSP